jgi:putative membrane-bound dehydrogenase-like protein
MCRFLCAVLAFSALPFAVHAADGNRLTYLDENNPYYVSRTFPKLITPQWVGELGVEAVVILAIDDMREPERYETFLRPILRRLQQIDGRSGMSIMTCQVDPQHPRLQQWLKEGVSLEVHTIDHPCPFFKDGDLAKAKSTYDRCVDLMHKIPGNKPVAFRMPCCDSLNTPSPRFWAEIFNKLTPEKHFLSIDSSVFNIFTPNDPALPRELVQDADGSERFRKYVPYDRSFVNTIEDYPYPYVIDKLCWEFPCVVPSDWEAQHLHKSNNPITVRHWKAALDCTVIKQGVFCLVFHPHGWIKNEQIVELIDHAVAKHGKKVKFLSFREALARINKNVLEGHSLRDAKQHAALPWSNERTTPVKIPWPLPPGARLSDKDGDYGLRFIDIDEDGHEDVVFSNEKEYGIYLFTGMEHGWSKKVMAGKAGEPGALPPIARNGKNNGFWVHSRSLWWSNENTPPLKDHVDRRSFNDLLKDVEPTAKSPQSSLACMQPRPGFTVELMAAEPLVQDPIAFAWGPDGKFWVVEMGDYPLGVDGEGKAGGRVKFLESTKGDGKYDKATIFLDNLPFPTGVMPWRKGVLITCAPDILYAEDTDGDGKADVVTKLYTGFVEGNQQHRVNGLTFGLDNWIYGANGDSGGRVKSAKTGSAVDIRGHDFRIRPDEGLIDLATGQTQYGRGRDDWGNWFGCNNSNPMYHFVLEDHYLRRNPHLAAPESRVPVSVAPGAAPVFPISRTLPRFNDPKGANHFTSACSAIVYRDDLFGPHFANNTFVSEPVHDLVHREIMTAKGITFTSRRAADEQASEFLASSDNWCRPTMIQTGPDGAFWIADMYRQVIEHPEWIPKDWQKRLDLRAGHELGRIYRVYPVGVQPRPIPRLDKLDAAGLIAALDSPSGWQRDMAQQMLLWNPEPRAAAVPLLEKLATTAERPLARLHALCTLDGLDALRSPIHLRALQDRHPGVVRHAVRLCDRRFAAEPQLGAAILKLIDHSDWQVRLQLAYTLGEWDDPRAGAALGQLAVAGGADRHFTTAVLSSVNAKNLENVLAAVMGGGESEPPSATLVEQLLRLASAMNNNKAITAVLTAVVAPKDGRYTAWHFHSLAGLLDSLDQRGLTLARLQEQADDSLRTALQRLKPLFAAARSIAADDKAATSDRLPAVALLGRGVGHQDEDLAFLAGLIVPQTPNDIQAAAVTALGKLRDEQASALLLRGWKGYGPRLRPQVLDVLLRRGNGVNAVLDAIETKHILPLDIDAAHRQRLVETGNTTVRERATRLLAGAVDPDRQKVLEAYRPVLTMRGDSPRGAQIFGKTCATCHRFGGQGAEVGPDLASLGDKSPESLLIAILDPNRAVEARYVSYYAVTKSGLTFTGLIANEAGNSLTLVGADGKPQVLLRNNLESLTSTNRSVMPDGIEKDLKPQDVADVIAYLRTGVTPPQRKTFDGNNPELARATADGSLHLTAKTAEIYGTTLVFEKQYSNLGYWSSEDDQAVWSVEVPKAGVYDVSFHWACEGGTAGNRFILQAGLEQLTGQVARTGSWDVYRQAKVGTITLAAGKQRVSMRSAGKISGAMIDLKEIKLVPHPN